MSTDESIATNLIHTLENGKEGFAKAAEKLGDSDRPEVATRVDEQVLESARATFSAYRAALAEIRADPYSGALPRDPSYLSWTLAACAPLPMAERQSLLEAEDTGERLVLVTDLLRSELRAMNVIPSLPATEVARTRWSPN